MGQDDLNQFPDLLQLPKSKFSVNTTVCSNSSSETVDSSSNNTSVGNSAPCTISSFATWHARLGHPNTDVMKLVSQICKIPSINKTVSDFCSHCWLEKELKEQWWLGFQHLAHKALEGNSMEKEP